MQLKRIGPRLIILYYIYMYIGICMHIAKCTINETNSSTLATHKALVN